MPDETDKQGQDAELAAAESTAQIGNGKWKKRAMPSEDPYFEMMASTFKALKEEASTTAKTVAVLAADLQLKNRRSGAGNTEQRTGALHRTDPAGRLRRNHRRSGATRPGSAEPSPAVPQSFLSSKPFSSGGIALVYGAAAA